jgi:hypothetical protein
MYRFCLTKEEATVNARGRETVNARGRETVNARGRERR